MAPPAWARAVQAVYYGAGFAGFKEVGGARGGSRYRRRSGEAAAPIGAASWPVRPTASLRFRNRGKRPLERRGRCPW